MTYIGPPASFDLLVSELVVLRHWNLILAYAATITIRLVFFVEAAGAEFYQQIPTGILILMSSTWGQNCIWEHVASILSVVEATCDRKVLSLQFTVCPVLRSFPYL